MLEFLWNVPVVLFEFALNVIFWGSVIGVLFMILKWGTEKYVETFKKHNNEPDDLYEKPEDWG